MAVELKGNCLKRDYKGRLKLKIEEKAVYLDEEVFDLDIHYSLSPFYKERLVKLCKDNKISESESLTFLLDYYYLDNATFMKLLSRQLKERLYKGVNKSFIIHLKMLYVVIGHFLKRLRYL